METEALISALIERYTPKNVASMQPENFCADLILNKFVKNEADFNLLVLEAIQTALINDDEFPIHYYDKDEPMSENGRMVGDIECLTDDYIANMLNGG